MNRRFFVHHLGKLAIAPSALQLTAGFWEELAAANRKLAHLPAKQLASDEAYWEIIRQAYNVSPNFINLENGYFSLQAQEVMEAQFQNIRMINEAPAFYMRREQWHDRERIRRRLAGFAGVDPEEIAILRNTTEALNILIQGLPLERGEEVVVSNQDYGSMLEAFQMRSARFGTVTKAVNLPLHPKSDQEIVDIFERAIGPQTKYLHVTHLINLSGQVLPVRKLVEMAHGHGVEVIVDAAHSFAHLNFTIPDLGCDYFGTSLHKWLGTPVGLGMLYVKKDKIEKVWPLMGDVNQPKDNIRKLEHIGTHPCASDLTIANAIKFHETIGPERKEARLRYLKNYWARQLKGHPQVVMNTPLAADRSAAIGNVGIKNMAPAELSKVLHEQYRVFTVAIDHPAIKGVRITPHLYNTLPELDHFVAAMQEIADQY